MAITDFINGFNLGLTFKIVEIVLVGLFIFYSILTLRQVSIMNQSLVTPIEDGVKAIGLIQLTLGVLVLFTLLLI